MRTSSTAGDERTSAVDEDFDPLYEPTLIAFIYAAWAAATWAISERVGLVVLVIATTALTIVAVREHRAPEQRTFVVDFGVILLFCAAAIALGVLVVTGVAASPSLFFGVLCLGLAAVLVAVAMAPTTSR